MKLPKLNVDVRIAVWVFVPDAVFDLLLDEDFFDLIGKISGLIS
jgi:hypothetical protein